MGLRIAQTPTPEVPDGQGCRASVAQPLHDQGRELLLLAVADHSHDAGAGLGHAHAVEHAKLGHLRQPFLFLRFIVTQPRPGLQPALSRQVQTHLWCQSFVGQAVQVDRQDACDRGMLKIALPE